MHKCNWNTITWNSQYNLPVFQYDDDIVFREGRCTCGKQVKEVYEKIGVFRKDEEIDLTEE